MSDLISLAALPLLVLAGALGLALVEYLVRRPVAVAALVMVDLVIEYTDVSLPSVSLGSAAIYHTDMVFVLVAGAAVARLLRAPRFTTPQLALLLLVAIALVSLVQGVAAFGLEDAINEARKWMLTFALAAYFSTVPGDPALLDRVARWIVIGGIALTVLSAVRWVAVVVGLPEAVLGDRAEHGLRVLHAERTLIIVQGCVILLTAWRRLPTSLRATGAAMLVTAMLMQHRTIWAATIGTVAVLMWRDHGLARRAAVLVPTALVIAVVLLLMPLGTDPESTSEHATDTSTFAWRFEGWQDLLVAQGPETRAELMFGKPFGAGWDRRVDNQIRDENPHSLYMESFLRFGLVGSGTLLALVWSLVFRVLRGPPSRTETTLLDDNAVIGLLVAQSLLGVTYFGVPTIGIVLGLAAGPMTRRRAVDRPTLQVVGEVDVPSAPQGALS